MSKPAPILTFAPKISPEAPAWLQQHLTLIYQKLNNHTQAMSLLSAKSSGPTTKNTTIQESVTTGGGGSSTPTALVGAVDDQSGVATYETTQGDYGSVVVLSDASPIAVTLASQAQPWFCWISNTGAGTATITPSSGTINGGVSVALTSGSFMSVYFDGTNWEALSTTPSSGGTVTAVTGTLPIVSSGSTAPVISVNKATSSTLGVVQPDNTTITVDGSGVISAVGGGGGYSLGGSLTSANFSLGAGAGSGASISFVVGLDGNHAIQIVTGTLPTASAVIYTCTFTTTRGHITYPVGVPSGGVPIASTSQIPFFVSLSATSYELFANSTALTGGSSYSWNVSCP